MDKFLMVSHIPSMIATFNMGNIEILLAMGFEVHVATNFSDQTIWNNQQSIDFWNYLTNIGVVPHQIDFPRKPSNPFRVLKAFYQCKKLSRTHKFCIIHTQSPVGGVIARFVWRHKQTIIIHNDHGIYYFKGGPLVNWLFYPIDLYLSKHTDVMLTINFRDYLFAKKHFYTKKIVRLFGVGFDSNRFIKSTINRQNKRRELGIPLDAFLIVSVGELNKNKNHSVIIRAIGKLDDKKIFYAICGNGAEKVKLRLLAKKMKIANRVLLLGFRNDVMEIYKCADLYAFPSIREGLGLSALEAMACGLPLVTSNIYGIDDYSINGITGFTYAPRDLNGFANGIIKLKKNRELSMNIRTTNQSIARKYDIEIAKRIMEDVYQNAYVDFKCKKKQKTIH